VVTQATDSRQRVLASTVHAQVGAAEPGKMSSIQRRIALKPPRSQPMKRLVTLVAATAVSVAALAQPVEGEVRKVDKAQAKVTLKHAEIKSLDMPPMTMVFRVKDAKMLDGLAEGTKVRFAAEKIDGQYTVTAITKQ
jgi:Cu/Ag efflux protein CusF